MFGPPLLPRTLDAALRDLGSTKLAVRADAVRDLVRHGDSARGQVVKGLEAALRDEAAPVRAAAATGLADLEGREALAGLLVAMEDDDARVRQMAIAALGEIGDPRATERLRRALGDRRPEVRFQALIAFPRVCADRESAQDALLQATFDADPLVCHIALRMAEDLAGGGKCGGAHPEAAEAADTSPARTGAVAAGALAPRFVERAKELLEHPSATVRLACAILLTRAGEKAPSGLFVKVARREETTADAEDEAAAIELCGELGLGAARRGLERRAFGGPLGLRKDPFAWHARVALARMGHERASRQILAELASGNRDRRTLAVAAAGRAHLAAARDLIAAMHGDEARADPNAVAEALAALAVPPSPPSSPSAAVAPGAP